MCKVYNTIGSLTAVKSYLHQHKINQFKSLKEVINFQKNYTNSRQKLFLDHTLLINQERLILNDEISVLKISIANRKSEVEQKLKLDLEQLKRKVEEIPRDNTNYFNITYNYFKKIHFLIKLQVNEKFLSYNVHNSVKNAVNNLKRKSTRYQYIESNFNDAVTSSCLLEIEEHDRIKKVIDEINPFIAGALGEHKVVKELKKLSDDFILINDFQCSFKPAIYDRKQKKYLKSVQIDHILVAPSGVFLIETKNWSQKSLANLSLRSPVEQIKRANFALFSILSGNLSKNKLKLNKHHWGERKIPIRNLIVLINHKPLEEFQAVKITTLKELLNYVSFFSPCFSIEETKMIADYLRNYKN
ncbi:hypothetical protein RCH18_001182 [Flavobacterium sp. PL11]|uniref:nuclease-related domain-containing protein n=1 Tax=Flavobacterium sp. PL11 TaxID=3071717 RepID=UPI002DFFF3DC|nr:hypothetical protein [Flavobacterium sp. PL11]